MGRGEESGKTLGMAFLDKLLNRRQDMADATQTVGQDASLSYSGHVVRQLLPQRFPFMLLDRVERYYPQEKRLIGVKGVAQNETFLQGHFPDYPIFPGVLIIESLAQASGMLMNLEYLRQQRIPPQRLLEGEFMRSLKVPNSVLADSKIKHIGPVYPGDQMMLETELMLQRDDMYTFRVCARVNGTEVTKGQLLLARSPLEGLMAANA
jgi:3-hydroxyacyl-[acyl-carrier-protein] dehydratase